ncbi:undecaprenyldiphospho-muramoylpentapeptide beta-N-acetylglucosaminyltransferase [Caloranaerobacter sp. DY30410]|uniref:undecaprenyldiphospho-muramoylpentapeptide beta-N-acetylglucosaminyltransferase n=1 Tax=Caloranaerobacter sp. DY30410 TaxID=3238305 RepID=UPI003D02478E
MKFLITGGGTGGHIYPALAIANKIKKEIQGATILYVGTEKGLEAELVPREGFDFRAIRVKGFRRKLSLDTLDSIKTLFQGLNDARKIINEFKPNVVIGTGGYVCGPVVFISALKKIPTLIHEQNAYPGVTNRILSRFVDKVAGSFEESIKYFYDSNKVTITGNPIRDDFLKINRNKVKSIQKDSPLILSFGGSGGQKKLNEAMLEVIQKNIGGKMQIIHVTGKRFYEDFIENLNKKLGSIERLEENIKVLPYLYDMPNVLASSDLVITSAGAITIAEITAVGVPSILIPKGYTTENHQEFNARALEKQGASVMILEKDLNGEILNKKINELINDKNKLKYMAQQSRRLAKIDATDRIFKMIVDLIEEE